MFLRFCSEFGLAPVPASTRTVIRFLIHLSSYCKYSTIINYLSAINVLHRHFGHDVTFQEVFTVKLIVRSLRRVLGDAREQKLPITPEILLRLRPTLTADSDSGFWAAMLMGFYSFFRKSNLVPKSAKDYDPSKTLLRKNIIVRSWGLVICVTWSKTIQFKERQLLIPVLRLPADHPLCPSSPPSSIVWWFGRAASGGWRANFGRGSSATPLMRLCSFRQTIKSIILSLDCLSFI